MDDLRQWNDFDLSSLAAERFVRTEQAFENMVHRGRMVEPSAIFSTSHFIYG
jgi:hypothetical protein